MPTFSQSIIWTVLPNGVAAPLSKNLPKLPPPNFVLSVLVSPRLVATNVAKPLLDLFPDFADWPARQPVNFKVKFANETPVVATRISQAPDSKLWKALFEAPVAVRSYFFRRLDRNFIYSYPAVSIHEFLKQNYIELSDLGSPPTVSKILGPKRFGQLMMPQKIDATHFVEQTLAKLVADYDIQLKRPDSNGSSLVKEGTALADFLKLILFHQPRTPKERKKAATIIAPPDPDFHDMIAHLGEYPLLLRRLGLVIDLSVPAPKIPTTALPTVMLVPSDFQPTPENKLGKITHQDITPKTLYTNTSPTEFRAFENPSSDIRDGFLKFNDTKRFQALQVDTDGAGLKAFNFANNLEQARGRKSAGTPEQAGLPALRSSGIGVFKINRATQFNDKMKRANTVNEAAEKPQASDPSHGITLSADDLTRGYRIDVREASAGSSWRSLCGRHERYTFSPKKQPAPEPLSSDAANPPEGLVTTTVGSKADGQDPGGESAKDLFLQESLFHWEGWSLCVRRPGIPLASSPDKEQKVITTQPGPNGTQIVPPDDTPNGPKPFPMDAKFSIVKGSLPRLRFGSQYQLRARTVDLAGNSKLPADANDQPATPPLTYTRFEPVAAPAVFRGSPRKDGDSLENVVIRTGELVPNTNEEKSALRHIAPPPVAQSLAEAHGMFDHLKPEAAYALISERDNPINNTEKDLDPKNFEKMLPEFPSKNPLDKQHLYLPDPAAAGVLARFFPSGTIVQDGFMSFYDEKVNDWPKFKAVRIQLVAAAKGELTSHTYDPFTRLLQIRLPPSATTRIQLSSQLIIDDLRKMGVYNWMSEAASAVNLKLDFNKIFRKGISTINPFRELRFVHAVQQPVEPPAITQLTAARTSLGQTTAVLSGLITVHGASTAKLDVLAEWDEYTGKGMKPDLPEIKRSSARVGELPVQASDTQIDFLVAAGKDPNTGKDLKVDTIHHFGDTKHRVVTYRVQGTSSFREYFLTLAQEKAKEKPPKQLLLTRDSAPFAALKIPNSARPPAPGVQYVIPTFRWLKTASQKGDEFSSLRIGGGLRVYLDGPWYASGAGELLAVILPSTDIASERLKNLMSQYGQDPIWTVAGGGTPLLPVSFALSAKHKRGLPLEEISNEFVTAIGFEVKFDGERWYSDLYLNSPFYFPFVRLALARYQPESLDGAHLSRVVQADFIQLPPSRITALKINTKKNLLPPKPERFNPLQDIHLKEIIATLKTAVQTTPPGSKDNSISVAVAGVAHFSRFPNAVMVALQRATSSRKSELDWEPASETVPLGFFTENMPSGFGAWRGDLPLPSTFQSGAFRVVVTEMEYFVSDVITPAGLVSPSIKDQIKPARVVYVDTIEI